MPALTLAMVQRRAGADSYAVMYSNVNQGYIIEDQAHPAGPTLVGIKNNLAEVSAFLDDKGVPQ